ncbi:MAG: DUF3566 domain-containing protein, partial [Ilumatobacter sp.]|uniref:DUF3566 domain-containing protein n=1 Tax=Ilumatobacter sp. TaxID=1967498 RepID=UPI003C770515
DETVQPEAADIDDADDVNDADGADDIDEVDEIDEIDAAVEADATTDVDDVETDDLQAQDDDLDAEADDLEVDAISDVDDEIDDVDATEDVDVDAFADDQDADDEYVMPEIVPATLETEALTTVGDPDPDLDADVDVEPDDVSEDILEELRQADIDGPVVPYAPQDDTTAAVRRPRRAADYDPAPVPIPAKVPRVLGRKPRVRKVTRVVRHVDPWSVFKIAIIAHLVLYLIVLTASVLLWNVANATGTVDNVERFFESFGWNSFEFNGGELYHAAWIAGLFVVIGMTGLAVLAATLFNLITDLVGGVRFTVLEEEVLETRTSPMRRFVVRRPEPEVPALLHDSSGAMYREAVVDDAGANQRPTR